MKTGKPHKQTHTRSETVIFTQKIADEWKQPPFQRQLAVNKKVQALSDQIRADGGVIPGVITIGTLDGDTYLLDGQHRVRAFLMSGHEEGYADLRIHEFESMGQMGQEFVNLNSRLVTLRPDDILRGMEESTPTLRGIRERCKFVGYDRVRKNAENAPFVSMSVLLRAWMVSARDAPSTGGVTPLEMVQQLTLHEASSLSDVALALNRVWGADPSYSRLWGHLNLTMCFWLYRRMVLDAKQQAPHGSRRYSLLSHDLFGKGMMALSADALYLDWLGGRTLTERHRSPCYARIKDLVGKRIFAETKSKVTFPQPEWAI